MGKGELSHAKGGHGAGLFETPSDAAEPAAHGSALGIVAVALWTSAWLARSMASRLDTAPAAQFVSNRTIKERANRMKQVLTAMLIAFLVAGCATPGQQATTEGTAGGAVLGALLGAGVGALAGGGRGAAIGAGAGAFLGGIAGYSYAQNIQSRRNALAGQENNLNAQLRFAEGVNQDTQEANRLLAQEIRASEDKVNALAVKTQQHQATQRELESQRQDLAKKVKAAEDQHALAARQLDELNQFRSRQPQGSPELDAQIAKLETQLQELKHNTTTLASLSQRL